MLFAALLQLKVLRNLRYLQRRIIKYSLYQIVKPRLQFSKVLWVEQQSISILSIITISFALERAINALIILMALTAYLNFFVATHFTATFTVSYVFGTDSVIANSALLQVGFALRHIAVEAISCLHCANVIIASLTKEYTCRAAFCSAKSAGMTVRWAYSDLTEFIPWHILVHYNFCNKSTWRNRIVLGALLSP